MIFALLSLREPLEEVWYGLVSFPCQNVTDTSLLESVERSGSVR